MSTPSLLNLPNEILYAIIELLDESSHCELALTSPRFNKPLVAHYLRNGGSLLHIAARHGRAGVVGLLLNDGADINARANGATALHIAAEHGNAGAVCSLLNHGADVHARANGSTALHIAAEHNQICVAELLLKKGAEINSCTNNYCEETALLIAIVRQKTEMVSLLLAFQADITSYAKVGGGTPLHLAAGHGDLEIVKLLIKHGADPNGLDRYGLPPLEWASHPLLLQVVMMLIDYGANYDNDWLMRKIWEGQAQ